SGSSCARRAPTAGSISRAGSCGDGLLGRSRRRPCPLGSVCSSWRSRRETSRPGSTATPASSTAWERNRWASRPTAPRATPESWGPAQLLGALAARNANDGLGASSDAVLELERTAVLLDDRIGDR